MSDLYEDSEILISWLSEYAYCKRRFYLKVVEDNERINQFIAEGIINHKSVDKPTIEKRRNIVKVTRLNVYNNNYHIHGICDNVEFIKDPNGVYVNYLNGVYTPIPIEYKHGKKRDEYEYQVQLMGQALCLEYMYNVKIDYGYIFYVSSKHRDKVEFTDELRSNTLDIINELKKFLEYPKLPEAKYQKRCNNCSIYEICSPRNKMIEKYMLNQRSKL